jgi:hypothetical protein
MSFQPVVPFGGFAGWQFLQRTLDEQRAAHADAPQSRRDTEYFAEKIGSVTTPEQLVADRRLLSVALGAFGLDEDIDAKAFVVKVLEEGTLRRDSLANRLADTRYRDFARAFGFGDGLPRTGLTGFAEEIVSAYRDRQFEIDVGAQDTGLRLALSLDRDLTAIAERRLSEQGKWFAVLGQAPLREVFETALGLPSAFGALDLDRQVETLQERARAAFGTDSISDFADAGTREDLRRLYLIRSELTAGPPIGTPGTAALTLLRGAAGPLP